MEIFAVLLAAVNIFVFALYGLDKLKAVTQKWRVPEKTLLLAAALFGSAGALAGMLIFRHKIRKPKFTITVPLLLAAHIAIAVWIAGLL